MSHVIISMVFLLLGYLIKYKKWSWLISGYNTASKKEKEKYDVDALCNSTGEASFILGGVLLLTSLGEFFDIAWIIYAGWIVFTVLVFAFVIYANTGNRYRK